MNSVIAIWLHVEGKKGREGNTNKTRLFKKKDAWLKR
jgi:hypothetical protein